MSSRTVIMGVGDIMVSRDDPPTAFTLVKPLFDSADIVFGNCESVYATTGSRNPATRGEVRGEPSNVAGLAYAGFDIMSLANNHTLDSGYEAFFETKDHLTEHGIATCGAGKDLEQSRRPVVVDHDGTKVAFLAYSTVMFPGYESALGKPGCTQINVFTHYTMSEIEQPGCEAKVATVVDPASLRMLREDVERAREIADIVVVTPHWGIHFTPVEIADYETELAHRAIDYGADLVLGHHQHILKGIQVYKGKVIFHGLGNFVMDVAQTRLSGPGVKAMQANNPTYAVGNYPDYPTYPFHPEARQTVVAKAVVEDRSITAVSFVPCLINQGGQPEPLRDGDPRFDEVAQYQQLISKEAGFETNFAPAGDEVLVTGS